MDTAHASLSRPGEAEECSGGAGNAGENRSQSPVTPQGGSGFHLAADGDSKTDTCTTIPTFKNNCSNISNHGLELRKNGGKTAGHESVVYEVRVKAAHTLLSCSSIATSQVTNIKILS